MKYKEKTDLTRWNRAGLSEFRYIDGNALTYLETLRRKLVAEYDRGDGTPSWSELANRCPERPGETRRQTRKRLQAQYRDQRRDYAWEILRSFARSAHVLGEYTNAYANEAYLPTAKEWDNVRRLVGMLGYRPAPPASAQTHVALLFKEGESGELPAGFAVKNRPGDGESTVVFETLEPVSGGSALNRLRLRDWNRNPQLIYPQQGRYPGTKPSKLIRFPLEQSPEGINVGDLGVLAAGEHALPVQVTRLWSDRDGPGLELTSRNGAMPGPEFRYHNTRLHLQAGFVESPSANGDGSARLKQHAALADNEIVFGKLGGSWEVRRVMQYQFLDVQFAAGKNPAAAGEQIHRARTLQRQCHAKLEGGDPVYILPSDFIDDNKPFVNAALQKLDIEINKVDQIWYIKGDHGERIFFPAEQPETTVAQAALQEIRFPGKAKGLESGAWTLATHANGCTAACRIDRIEQSDQWFQVALNQPGANASSIRSDSEALEAGARILSQQVNSGRAASRIPSIEQSKQQSLSAPNGTGEHLSLLRSAFKLSLRPRGHDINQEHAWYSGSNDSVTVLELEDVSLADSLQPGRKLICAGAGHAVALELKRVVTRFGRVRLHVTPAFHRDPRAALFTRHHCTLYANVAKAGHGESQPEKILGHGDASRPGQSFTLPPERISWVADAGFTSGVRADLVLRVGQRVWRQVENLAHSQPEEHHYQVLVDQDGVLTVRFGDGRHGRRLPTGVENIRVRYRTGCGEEGNLEPHALESVVRPQRLIAGFAAPLAGSGGAEKEAADSMRENAPATVLALQRAVSLDDFTHLAAHHSMVWQARAFERMPDRPARSRVEVVVVAAGGERFNPESEIAALIRGYLRAHAAPDTPVSVVSYAPVVLRLEVTIEVDESAYDKRRVQQAVREQLESGLALRSRRLGQPLFRSEVIALVEQVEGVENAHCTILDAPYDAMPAGERPRLHRAGDGTIRRVSVKPHQLLFLETSRHLLIATRSGQ